MLYPPTRLSRILRTVWPAALTLTLLACNLAGTPMGAPTESSGSNNPPGTTPIAREETPLPFTPQPPDTAVGPACLSGSSSGVSCLTDAGWKTYTRENSSLSSNTVIAINPGPQHSLYFLNYQGLDGFDAQESWMTYGSGWGINSPSAFSIASNNRIWVTHFKGVSYFNDQTWTTVPAAELSIDLPENILVNDVAAAPNGQAWVITAASIAHFTEERWEIYQKGHGFDQDLYFTAIALDSQAQPWITCNQGMVSYQDGKWKFFPNNDITMAKDIVVDREDRIWVASFSQGIYRFDGLNWKNFTTENSGLISNNIRSLATDSRNRIWVGTDWGISILDGETWHTYQMHTSDLATNEIQALGIVGSGPDSLPEPQTREPGELSGNLRENGQPLADVPVKLCVGYPGLIIAHDPCADYPLDLSTKTDAEGHFTVTDIPRGFYTIMVNSPIQGWIAARNEYKLPTRILIEAGQKKDMGDIALD